MWNKKIHQSVINTSHNVCKSKISFTEIYEFIRHIHECLFNFVYLYDRCISLLRLIQLSPDGHLYILRTYRSSFPNILVYSCADLEGAGGPEPIPHPLENQKNIGFLSVTGLDPLENLKTTKPLFDVGQSSASWWPD